MNEPIERPGARVVVLDEDDRILLLRSDEDGRAIWVMPGGALEAGETPEQAAARELREEVSLANLPLEGLSWVREHVWTWSATGETYASRERFFLARVHEASVVVESPALLTPILEARWWSVAELEEGRTAGVEIVPRRLPEHLRSLLEHGPRAEIVDVGV